MKKNFENFDWEKCALLELYEEYTSLLRQRKISMRPAAIALFDSELRWGQWNPLTRTIHISRKLIRNHTWFQVLSILKHEMAHQYLDELASYEDQGHTPHGEKFYWACQIMGVPAEYSKASIDLQTTSLSWQDSKSETSDRMMDKVRKLLSLATSNNEHEALLAMNKVREIYARYNLDETHLGSRKNFIHLVVPLKKKRIEAHESRTIGILVGHFFVQVITMKLFEPLLGESRSAFEIVGSRENVLMAEYVYHFLIRQTELLLKQAAEDKPLTRFQKKSFRLGILSGFSQKLTDAEQTKSKNKEEASEVIGRALMKFKKSPELENYLSEIYPRLSNRTLSSQHIDGTIFSKGHAAGQNITLNKPVHTRNQSSGRLLK
jgi:hypothetical protein